MFLLMGCEELREKSREVVLRELKAVPIYQLLQACFSILSTRSAMMEGAGEYQPGTIIFIGGAGDEGSHLRN